MEAITQRNCTCDFSRIVTDDGVAFGDVVDQVMTEYGEVADRNIDLGDGFIRISNWTRHGDDGAGVFIRGRQQQRRIVRFDDDTVRELNLQAGEALVDYCCFHYRHDHAFLVTQRNKLAGTAGRIAAYLSHLSGHRIEAQAVLTREGLERLDDFAVIRRLQMSVAVPDQSTLYDDYPVAVKEAFGSILGHGRQLNLTISCGNHRRSRISTGFVKDLVGSLLAMTGGDVKLKKARVSGTVEGAALTDEHQLPSLDLVEARYSVEYQVPAGTTLDGEVTALTRAYNGSRGFLLRQFTANEEVGR